MSSFAQSQLRIRDHPRRARQRGVVMQQSFVEAINKLFLRFETSIDNMTPQHHRHFERQIYMLRRHPLNCIKICQEGRKTKEFNVVSVWLLSFKFKPDLIYKSFWNPVLSRAPSWRKFPLTFVRIRTLMAPFVPSFVRHTAMENRTTSR